MTSSEGSTWATTPSTELIAARRSVRSGFRDEPVPPEVLREIVRAGLAAPSSKNARPWRLHVVTDRALLAEIADTAESAEGASTYVPVDPLTGRPRDWPSSVPESAAVLREVPAAIFVENLGAFSRGRRTLAALPPGLVGRCLVGYTFELIGIGAAVENMWLAANGLGVQAAYMGDPVIAEDLVAARLDLEVDLVGVLALGYSDEAAPSSRVVYDLDDGERVVWHPPAASPPQSPSL